MLEELSESGGTVQARITGYNRGGAVVDVDGLQAFIPLSQAVLPQGVEHEAALAARVGEEVTVKVLEVNRRRNRAVLSERAAMREQREGLKDKLLDLLEEGERRTGRVTGVSSFGAFVDIGGADGLIHISELSWAPRRIRRGGGAGRSGGGGLRAAGRPGVAPHRAEPAPAGADALGAGRDQVPVGPNRDGDDHQTDRLWRVSPASKTRSRA